MYTDTGIAKPSHNPAKNLIKHSDITSRIGGGELGGMLKLWRECAISEARIKMIADLKNRKLGFNEIEQFGLGLKYSLKSRKLAENNEKPIESVIQAAMKLKLRDEIHHNQELKKDKNIERKKLARRHHQQTENYKRTMKYLKQEAEKKRREQTQKYRNRIDHLEKRYRERE